MVHGDAGRDLAGPVVEADAVAEHALDHRGHVGRLERAADIAVAHAAAGAERHLAVLNVKRRVREQIVVAGVVVMHVADDDILDPVRIDADRQEPVARRTQKLAPALFRHRRVEAGVEDQRPALADNGPDEIVERHRPVMRVAAVEIVSRHAMVVRIAHGIDLIGVAAHRCGLSLVLRHPGRRPGCTVKQTDSADADPDFAGCGKKPARHDCAASNCSRLGAPAMGMTAFAFGA